MTGADVVLVIAGAVAVGAGVLASASRVVVHSVALWVLSVLGTAGCLMVLGGDAVAGVLVLATLVAASAIVAVTLAVTRGPLERHDDFDVSWARRAGAAGAGALAAVLLGVALVESVGWHEVPVAAGGATRLAVALLGQWWWALVLLALLAVTTLVAASMLHRGEEQA